MSDETQKKSDEAVWAQIADLTKAALDGRVFTECVEELRAKRGGETIQEPVKAIERIIKQFSLTDGESESVLKHLTQGGDLSQYGLCNAVTRAAQDCESYDRSTELEYMGAGVIELPKSSWTQVAA